MDELDDVEVRDFEFDANNLKQLAAHGLDESGVWDVWLDEPVLVPDLPRHSGTHLMIGIDTAGLMWTIALVRIDDELGLWRPITGFPTEREDERNAWYGEP